MKLVFFKPLFFLFGLAIVLGSCSTYSDDQLDDFDRDIESYLKKNNINCQRSETGLYYKIIEPGQGDQVQYRDVVSFTYRGEFLNGKVFDEQKEAVEFEVSKLIGAWREIMVELKPGGKAFLVAPPQLGYGSRELDDIPENSILVFSIELLDVN